MAPTSISILRMASTIAFKAPFVLPQGKKQKQSGL